MMVPKQLIKGDRVRLSYAPTWHGVVVMPGPEQSEISLDGEKKTLVFVNTMLVRIVERAKSRRNEK